MASEKKIVHPDTPDDDLLSDKLVDLYEPGAAIFGAKPFAMGKNKQLVWGLPMIMMRQSSFLRNLLLGAQNELKSNETIPWRVVSTLRQRVKFSA